jgi:hypothetical protein
MNLDKNEGKGKEKKLGVRKEELRRKNEFG